MNDELGVSEKADALAHTIGSAGWQKVIKPALSGAIAVATEQWLSGERNKGEEHLTDNELKQRVMALKWVASWERTYKSLAEQVDAMNRVAEGTKPATEGGSPYVD